MIGNARVCDNSRVYDDACVYDNAQISGNACVYDDAYVYDNAQISDNAWVRNDACVYDDAYVYDNAQISGNACVSNDANISSSFDYCTISSFGSEGRTTTFFKCKNGVIKVNCGCFNGTINEFRDKVKETHGDNKYAQGYLKVADLIEWQLSDK